MTKKKVKREIKDYLVSFTVSRIYESECDGEHFTKAQIKEQAEQDFYDDARHGNIEPEIRIKKVNK